MKKIFLSLATLFALVTGGNAQNTSPYWSLAGNSNTTSSSKLGTTNSIDLSYLLITVKKCGLILQAL